jgi:PAS domain S-box-containing protein
MFPTDKQLSTWLDLNKEQIFRSFMENTPTMTWILDEKGCFRYMNSSYMKAFGLSEAAIGRSIYEFYPSDLCDSYVAGNQLVWASNSPAELTERSVFADGSPVILQVYKFPLGVENGVRLVGGTALDITQAIHTREELIQSNERYLYAGKATSDAIWDWKIGEDKIYRGEGFKVLFGYQDEAGSFDTNLAHIHPGDRKNVRSSLEKALAGKDDHWQLEYRFRCLDGTYRTILDKAYILRSPAYKAVRMIGAMQDITEQRNLEKMLVEEEVRKKRQIVSAIMEAQEKERREISSELHDNVNQILTTCKLFLEIARNDPSDARFIDVCHQNIQTVIEEIRNISHNLTPYTLKDLGLAAAMHDIVQKINQSGKLMIRLLSLQNLEEDSISPDIKLAVFRIVQEKINNVLKHSQATELTIEITVRDDRRLLLVLMDNGRGFDEKAVKKGMGLNNIRNRVEFHKGTMQLKTAPGSGCELIIEIPCS